MGYSRFDDTDWTGYTSSISSKTVKEVFTNRNMTDDFNPKNVKMRESCDSTLNPLSTPIIVGVDNTGSMGKLSELIIRKGLGVLINEIYSRKPVSDPHVMLMAIGDSYFDNAPLQVSQFEADVTLAKQLEKFFLEGGGGGNSGESYHLAWYFAANKTKCDAFLKRGKKGYLFTVGDEPPLPTLKAEHVLAVFGDNIQGDLSSRDLFTAVSKCWEVYHITIDGPGHKAAAHSVEEWKDLIGQRALVLEDHEKLSELIVSTMQVHEGASVDKVASSWSGGTELVIRKSLNAVTSGTPSSSGSGVTAL